MSAERRICVTHGIEWPCPSCALRSAEREVLEAALEWRKDIIGRHWQLYGAIDRYRALLDGKAEGEEGK